MGNAVMKTTGMERLLGLLAALLVLSGIWLPLDARAAERVALVIGNGAYHHGNPLKNPTADAKDVAAALKSCGFELTGGKALVDLDHLSMEGALRTFRKAAESSGVALFYFAGHGLEVGGENYLVPVDAQVEAEYEVKHRTLALDKVLGAMAGSDDRLKIVILDCCRNNPLGRGWSRGDAAGLGVPKSTPRGTILVFAAAPGQVAKDGKGDNSPFSGILKTELLQPGVEIERMFKTVGAGVLRATGSQEPWMNTSYYGTFSFLPGNGGGSSGGGAMAPSAVTLTAADRLRAATVERPFVNSLEMEFVPVPGKPGVYMCRTETRVRDFESFVDATDYDATEGAHTLESGGWKQAGGSWRDPRFQEGSKQSPDHPVVCVSWEDAHAFCEWLGGQEEGLSYRLPSDAEWSAAVGTLGKYPWGNEWPPPKGAGNYAGSEANTGAFASNNYTVIEGYHDGAPRTARVASFRPNRFGFYDLGGNVWEWCEDRYRASMNDGDVLKARPYLKEETSSDGILTRVVRGGSWYLSTEMALRSSFRYGDLPIIRSDAYGFRVVVEAAR